MINLSYSFLFYSVCMGMSVSPERRILSQFSCQGFFFFFIDILIIFEGSLSEFWL